MLKIKVGQVWKNAFERIVITHKHENLNVFCYIDDKGVTVYEDDAFFIRRNYKLLAEYPTWQEAINSEEFRNDLFFDNIS